MERVSFHQGAFQQQKRNHASIKLSNNHINLVNVHRNMKETTFQKRFGSIDLSFNHLNCCCDFLNLVKHLTNFSEPAENPFINFEHLRCQKTIELQEKLVKTILDEELRKCLSSPQHFTEDNCPEGCKCKHRSFTEGLVVNCQHSELRHTPTWLPLNSFSNHTELNLYSNRLEEFRVPRDSGYDRVIHLNLAKNYISSIDISGVSINLKKLDISYNIFNKMNEETVQKLEALQLERLELQGNPWVCNCSAKRLIQFVQANQHLIKHLIYCEDGTSMMLITDPCRSNKTFITYMVSDTTVVLLTFVLALTLLYNIYRRQVHVYCYSSRWKIVRWLVSYPDVNEDKEYDAFVSFSHEDSTFVMNHLVPFLEESGERKYKLCLHYRDWIPGETILSQIVRSVQRSRRTIVVLSPHFLESVWGVTEFQTAHSMALRGGTTKVIVVLYKDVGPTNALDEELKTYLQMNTYIKWDSPWFWKQLSYAMPHL